MHVGHIFVFIFLQNMDDIPEDIKNLYKTVWEISQKTVMKMAADRGAYIDQSQSLNIHIAEPNYGKLTSMHFYAWKLVSTFYSQVSRTHRYLYVYFFFSSQNIHLVHSLRLPKRSPGKCELCQM